MIYQAVGNLPLCDSREPLEAYLEVAIEHYADARQRADRLTVEDAPGWTAPRVRVTFDANPAD